MTNTIVDILLVEDRVEDAELCILALNEHNLANSIKWVKNGEEALDFLFSKNDFSQDFSKRPKIVLLDIKMPKIDGIEVLREIRAHESTKTMPVIMLTTSNEDKDLIEAYNLNVNSYVIKPVEFDNFTKAVRDLGLYWLIINQPPIK